MTESNEMLRLIALAILALSPVIGPRQCGPNEVSAAESDSQEQAGAFGASDLQVAPIIRVCRGKHILVQAELRNGSGRPFRYFGGNRVGHPIASLDMELMRGDETIPWVDAVAPPAQTSENVRILDPGRSLRYRIALEDYGIDERRGNLPVGRYELWAKYSILEHAHLVKAFGLTSASIDRLVAIIELVDERSSAATQWTGALVGLGAGLIAGVIAGRTCSSVCRKKPMGVD